MEPQALVDNMVKLLASAVFSELEGRVNQLIDDRLKVHPVTGKVNTDTIRNEMHLLIDMGVFDKMIVEAVDARLTDSLDDAIDARIENALEDYDPTDHSSFEDAVRNNIEGAYRLKDEIRDQVAEQIRELSFRIVIE